MFDAGSVLGSCGISGCELRHTMHWRSAPRWSQPPELVVQYYVHMLEGSMGMALTMLYFFAIDDPVTAILISSGLKSWCTLFKPISSTVRLTVYKAGQWISILC